jgi:hypothetical protein
MHLAFGARHYRARVGHVSILAACAVRHVLRVCAPGGCVTPTAEIPQTDRYTGCPQ